MHLRPKFLCHSDTSRWNKAKFHRTSPDVIERNFMGQVVKNLSEYSALLLEPIFNSACPMKLDLLFHWGPTYFNPMAKPWVMNLIHHLPNSLQKPSRFLKRIVGGGIPKRYKCNCAVVYVKTRLIAFLRLIRYGWINNIQPTTNLKFANPILKCVYIVVSPLADT